MASAAGPISNNFNDTFINLKGTARSLIVQDNQVFLRVRNPTTFIYGANANEIISSINYNWEPELTYDLENTRFFYNGKLLKSTYGVREENGQLYVMQLIGHKSMHFQTPLHDAPFYLAYNDVTKGKLEEEFNQLTQTDKQIVIRLLEGLRPLYSQPDSMVLRTPPFDTKK